LVLLKKLIKQGKIVLPAPLPKLERWLVNMFRIGPRGTKPYSAPEVTKTPFFHKTMTTTKADVWSWGAVLYSMTYNQPPDYNYTPPCYRPPANQYPARDSYLLDVLRHTLVNDPRKRCDTPWLTQHPYTRTV
jgi:serine/threonine protein kinase